MEITSKEKMITFAMIGLCAVIGVMSFLSVVYYGQANGMNSQTAHLQSLVDQLQAEKADSENQINSLNAQVANLTDRLATLTKENSKLTSKLNKLMDQMHALTGGVDRIEAKFDYLSTRKPLLSENPPTVSKDRDIIR